MSAEIEGEVRELHEERAVVLAQPGQALVSRDRPTGPAEMVAVASQLATILKDIVDRQRLYATISNKRYPTVEAWMTIARMDNVVAREAQPPLRHDDGSYEGFAELIRLSDGMIIGRASALCGTQGDSPWDKRPEPSRRSMAVTRATSRAFRQQYSWIMALAGYEPTPAEEMPRDDGPAPASTPEPERTHDGGLIGTAELGKGDADFDLRQTPDGYTTAFRLVSGRKSIKVIVPPPLAEPLALVKGDVIGKRVTCFGHISDETFRPRGATKDVTYQVLTLARIEGPDFVLPAPVSAPDAELEVAALELDAIAEGLPA
jgi:hypothetical protein